MADIMRYFNVDGFAVLHGSLSVETHAQQLFWFKLMCLCSISRVYGVICLDEKTPYPIDRLAVELGFSVTDTVTLLKYNESENVKRIKTLQWGGIELLNWEEHQNADYRRKRLQRERVRRFREKQKDDCNASVTHDVTQTVTPPVTRCNAPEENRKEENRKEDDDANASSVPEDAKNASSETVKLTKLQQCKIAFHDIGNTKKALFPLVDFAEEWRKIQVYAEKSKRDFNQKSDWNKFCLNWLNRAQGQAAYRKEQYGQRRGERDKLAWRGKRRYGEEASGADGAQTDSSS